MRVSFELTLFGQAFHLGTYPEDEDDQGDDETESTVVVTGAHSSVEFGFAPEVDDYWTEEDRGPRRRR